MSEPKNSKILKECYIIETDWQCITGELKKKDRIKKPIVLRPVGYTRMNVDFLKEIIRKIRTEYADVILYKTKTSNEPLIRIENQILAPNISDWNPPKAIKVEIKCDVHG